jgi:hypothetical protein
MNAASKHRQRKKVKQFANIMRGAYLRSVAEVFAVAVQKPASMLRVGSSQGEGMVFRSRTAQQQ